MAADLTDHGREFNQDVIAVNEALMLGLVRQHELTEAAELLNAQLREESAARQKAEEALVSSEKLASVGRMAAVLAHEINNPLEAVMNLLFLAQTAEGLPEQVRHHLLLADGELKRIAHITRQTLGFYRESVAPSTFHLTSMLDSVLDVLQAKVLSRQAIVEKQCDEDLEMNALQGELRQVLSNLVMNSVDAVEEGGKITLRATRSTEAKDGHRFIRITVADSGKG